MTVKHPARSANHAQSDRPVAFIVATLLCALATLAAVVGLNYVIDPLQMVRRSEPAAFYTNNRYQAAGLIRSFAHDTVVVGSSMTANLVPGLVEQALGGRVINLSISGAHAVEDHDVLRLALERGGVRRVLWGADWFVSARDDDSFSGFPVHLYRSGPLGTLRYLMGFSTLSMSVKKLCFRAGRCGAAFTATMDGVTAQNEGAEYSCRSVLAYFAANRHKPREEHSDLIRRMGHGLATYMVPLVESHPEVEFIVFLQPYSLLEYKLLQESSPEQAEAAFAFRAMAVAALAGHPNVRLYDFQVDPMTRNLAIYRDTQHYGPEGAALVLEAITSDTHRVRRDAAADITDQLRMAVATYQPPSADQCP